MNTQNEVYDYCHRNKEILCKSRRWVGANILSTTAISSVYHVACAAAARECCGKEEQEVIAQTRRHIALVNTELQLV